MMKYRFVIFFTTLFFSTIFCFSSVVGQEHDIEKLFENQEEFSDVSNLLQILDGLENNPLDINSASSKELAIIPWISDILASEIVEYRKKHGNFSDINELLNIKSFNPSLLSLIKKYIQAGRPAENKMKKISMRTRTFYPIDQKVGLNNGYYFNSPIKFYNQLKTYLDNKWKIGFLLEKDSGEQKINDFHSIYLKYDSPQKGHSLIVGNYLLEFAQGLVFWNPYPHLASGNSNYTVKKRPRNAVEYTLVDENSSLLGVAAKICFKFYHIYLFYSSNKYDATIDSTDGTVRNFYISGYHRNMRELKRKNTLDEKLIGVRLKAQPYSKLHLGMTAYHSKFDKNFRRSDLIRYRFAFEGNSHYVTSMDYDWTIGKLNLFGEMAQSQNSGFGFISGISLDTKRFDFGILYRNYSKDFISLHGNSYGSFGNSPQNEQGLYFGFNIKFSPKLKYALYFDHYHLPWRTYFIPLPSQGQTVFTSLNYSPIQKLWLYFQIKRKIKDDAINTADQNTKVIVPRKQINIRFQVDYTPAKNMRIRNRIEKNWVNYDKAYPLIPAQSDEFTGMLLYQDCRLVLNKNLVLSGRFTVFDTDGYESRVYQFENDLPGILTNRMLYGKGSRWYLMVNFRLTSLFRLSIKYSSTHYYYKNSLGYAGDKIIGDKKDTIKFQLDTVFN